MLNERSPRDAGFTLIELVVSIVITGVIVASLAGVVVQYARFSNDTATRLNATNDEQFISTYWQQDVSSLGSRSFSAGATDPTPQQQSVWTGTPPSGIPVDCTGVVGTVIGFGWNEYQASTASPSANPTTTWTTIIPNAAIYVATQVSSGQWNLERIRCDDTTTTHVILARHLTGAPTPTCYSASGATINCDSTTSVPERVSLTFTATDTSDAAHASTGVTNMTLTADRRQG